MRTRQKRRGRTPSNRTTPDHSSIRSPQPNRETALRTRIAELEEELRARDDFLSLAAHELRNPMTPISARVELLLASARNAPAGVPLGIARGLEQLEQLVNAYLRRATVLLEVSRITSGNLRLQPSRVDLSALLRQAASKMSPLAERAGCPVRLSVQDDVVGWVDAMATEQVLENLLSNAVRYAPGQPIEVGLVSDGDVAQLSVRDEGVGISEHDQARIFQRFYRTRRTSPNGGFGVGLWVTRRLVRAMQGEITVSSNAGAGSTFAVRLPLWRDGENDAS